MPRVTFEATSEIDGFDAHYYDEWSDKFKSYDHPDSNNYMIPYKSTAIDSVDSVLMVWTELSIKQRGRLKILVGDSTLSIDYIDLTKDTVTLFLSPSRESYRIDVELKNQFIGRLYVRVYPRHKQNVIIIPLLTVNFNKIKIGQALNEVFNQAQLDIALTIKPKFKYANFSSHLLDNPSEDKDRYTDQMKEIRDAYFKANPNAKRSAYYIFVIPGFVNEDLKGYMVRNKGVGFIKIQGENAFIGSLTRQLGYGIGALEDSWVQNGPVMGSTNNLMDVGVGTKLTRYQWVSIQHNCQNIMLYDDYEEVRTNSGLIAFYLWEEDENGNINHPNNLFLNGINRPFKRNQYSYHLDVTNFFFVPLFKIKTYRINLLHFLGFILLSVGLFLSARRTVRWMRTRSWNFLVVRWVARIVLFAVYGILCLETFVLINSGYSMYVVDDGEIKEYSGYSMKQTLTSLAYNNENPSIGEDQLGSQIMVKKKGKWILKKRKNVLYFNHQVKNGKMICRYFGDSDSLKLSSMDYADRAESHYMVFNYYDSSGVLRNQKVFNHLGSDITAKMKLKNPSKRILVFVNGYRPTSLGQTFEKNFSDIQENGLEFPNSSNMIYDFDRYGYWRPWREIDLKFERRINPEETYYADGHFSVSTTNHRSLVSFTSLSGAYPKRCRNKNNHICKSQGTRGLFGLSEDKTVTLFNLEPNIEGFDERKMNGRIAGRNLYQLFNEIPNKSDNDTLYIVAHSMGYAYALGIIDELRGKIKFGGLYIIAPENASAGTIKMSEWNEVWQYGNNFEKYKYTAPCLLDGIAPQTKVGGLSKKFRAYFPESLYKRKGFFESHFIGNYTWIFDLTEKEKGYIQQR